MRSVLFAIAIAFGPLPLEAIRSFACNAGYSWIPVTVGSTETVEIRSQPSGVSFYYNDMNCSLILTAESSNDQIAVHFSTFQVVSPDAVMLYDEARIADSWMSSYGSLLQPFKTTLTSTMRVNMLTDSMMTSIGFVANVYVTASSSVTSRTATARAAPTATSVSQSLSSASWLTPSMRPSSLPAGALKPSTPPPTLSEDGRKLDPWRTGRLVRTAAPDSASPPNASSNSSSGCKKELSTSLVSRQARDGNSAPGLQSNTSVVNSIFSKVRYSPISPSMPRGTPDHFYIKYLPGSQISAFHISTPIMLSYLDAPSTWINGDFSPTILGIASVLGCDPDRIQKMMFQPTSRFESELQLLILSPRDAYDTTALLLGTKFSYQMQNPSSPLRSVEILELAPYPPINVTLREILVTICSNSTYAVDGCPGSNAEVASVRQGRITVSNFVTVMVSVTVLSALVAIPLYVRTRKRRKPYNASGSQAFPSPEAINCEDFELDHPGQSPTKHRAKLSFALPTVNQHHQVKRVAYDEMQMTLAPDEEQSQNYMKKRHGSFHFGNEDGNISAME